MTSVGESRKRIETGGQWGLTNQNLSNGFYSKHDMSTHLEASLHMRELKISACHWTISLHEFLTANRYQMFDPVHCHTLFLYMLQNKSNKACCVFQHLHVYWYLQRVLMSRFYSIHPTVVYANLLQNYTIKSSYFNLYCLSAKSVNE